MTNPRKFARACAVGSIALGGLVLAACSPEQQAFLSTAAAQSPEATLTAARSTSGPSDSTLAALRNCESHGNYGAVSRSGTYRGAYQFSRSTWNNAARSVLPGYVDVDPKIAPPEIQDALARALWNATGPRSWPRCGPRAA